MTDQESHGHVTVGEFVRFTQHVDRRFDDIESLANKQNKQEIDIAVLQDRAARAEQLAREAASKAPSRGFTTLISAITSGITSALMSWGVGASK
jgi:adenine/guanine phosphoribosyltransferase-like PRPP-binding protein